MQQPSAARYGPAQHAGQHPQGPDSSEQDGWPRSGPHGVSALDLLMKQGETIKNGMERKRPPITSGKSHIYEKAFALSRSTSVKRKPQQKEVDPEVDSPEPEEDEWDDRRSINLLAGFAPAQGNAASHSQHNAARQPQYHQEHSPVDDGPGPRRFDPPTDHDDGDGPLLSNAFRNSVSSDASFNTITGQNDRDSIMFGGSRDSSLMRRDSVDTVRSAEFAEGGRWGRAWANKAEDEESIYGGSEWGSEAGDDDEDEPERGFSRPGGGLDALRHLANGRGLDGLTINDVSGSTATVQHANVAHNSAYLGDASPLHLQDTFGKERVVSLTPSVHNAPDGPSDQNRDSISSYGSGSEAHSPPRSNRFSTDSTSTIGADGARVFVWPPTPSGSDVSHGPFEGYGKTAEPDAASIHEWEAVSEDGDSQYGDASRGPDRRHTARPDSVATIQAPRDIHEAASQVPAGPATISSVLTNSRPSPRMPGSPRSPRTRPLNRPSSMEGKRGGHPAGRLPPPPPPVSRYEDPNSAMGPGGIGKTRAAAIAAADGRESIISDLDVETLRLEGSSRRDSSSTIGSQATSRMSIGTVKYDDLEEMYGSPKRPSSRDSTSGRSQTHWHPMSRGPSGGSASSAASSSIASSSGSSSTHISRNHPQDSRTPLQRTAVANASRVNGTPPLQAQQTGSQSPKLQSKSSRHTVGQDTRTGPTAAENYLTQGIQYHEQGDMSRSAYYFERSAKVDGGCVVGMCMWGMTLREGWGARKDPRKGFEWIQRAASKAGEMMQDVSRKTEAEIKAIRSELKLSVYELGKCFCYGWGVKMDKRMALEYFELAAKLGDADAQAEAGALYASGKGCKKDLKKAAKYYRMAAAQGYDLIGLSWVWKPKFDD